MFHYLEYIKAIDECGSFTRAAEKLCITQPALSIAIRKAEEELGVKLCDRNKKLIRLTENGHYYLKAANEAALIEKKMKDTLLENTQTVSGQIRIGAAGISMTYLVPEILDLYFQSYPKVSVEVTEESLYTLKDLLKQGEIDVIVDTEWFDGELDSARLFQNKIFYAIPEKMLLEKKKQGAKLGTDLSFYEKGLSAEEVLRLSDPATIQMSDVLDIPYLSLQPRNEIYQRAERYFSYYKCKPHTCMNFNQQLTAYKFVQRGYGATFVSDTLIRYSPAKNVRFYLFDCPMPERWIAVGYKKNSYLSSAVKAFITVAQNCFHKKTR